MGHRERTALNNLRNLALWILIALLLVLLFNLFQGSNKSAQAQQLSYTAFTQEVVKGNVQKITLSGDEVKGELRNNTQFVTMVPPNDQTMWTTSRSMMSTSRSPSLTMACRRS